MNRLGDGSSRVEFAYARDEAVAIIEAFFSRVGLRAETAGLYLLVSFLWGFVIYFALAFALQ